MAVVQISKIQLRRGKKLETGLPQLASGEMAWAIDTQELFIGNGAVSEGAPAVGNTKVLTEQDNILDLLNQYQYKSSDPSIATGLNGDVTRRGLQARLDDGSVNAASFGITNTDVSIDQTELIQNAIWSLYLTTTSTNRVALEFDPGQYLVTGTIYIPSNVRLRGSGKDLTAFSFIKGAVNYGATKTLSGTAALGAAGTYTNLATTTTSSTGFGAVVSVTTSADNNGYATRTDVTFVSNGAGYVTGDQIRVLGSLLGGTNTTNDLVITVTNAETGSHDYPVFGTGTVFEFINDSSTRTSRNTSSTSLSNQAKNIVLKDFTVEINNNDIRVFNVTNVRDSEFNNIKATGAWDVSGSDEDTYTNSIMLDLTTVGSGICARNKFIKLHAERFTYGAYSNTAIEHNIFDDCIFRSLYKGISFGEELNTTDATDNGPRKNIISESLFEDISLEGIIVNKGYGNRSSANTFINVGDDQGGNATTVSGCIKFTVPGNSSTHDNFDRANPFTSSVDDIARSPSKILTVAYVPEVQGHAFKHEVAPTTIQLTSGASTTSAFRLPLNDVSGFEVSYVFRSSTLSQMRKGVLRLAVDTDRLAHNTAVQIVDEYEYIGTSGSDSNLVFSAVIKQADGIKSIVVQYTSTTIGTNTFTYTYTALS
jgi:hypothetical protein